MVSTVIFDIGNVLKFTDFTAYLERLFPDEALRRRVRGAIWGSGCWAALDRGAEECATLAQMIATEPTLEREIRLAYHRVGEAMTRADYAIPWLTALRARGLTVLYLSNYALHTIRANPAVLDFLPHMDGGLFSFEVGLVKPDPALYRLLCARYRLDPASCVFLDDAPENVAAAQALGMQGIHFRTYPQARAALEGLIP